jgi:AcrR family transcriptional regulator
MTMNPPVETDASNARARLLEAASELIAAGGVAALTTRAVAIAAGVQAPTLYRLFGDKRGLLDAVAAHGLSAFIARKVAAEPHPDPVQDLRDAWDAYVLFGLGNPAVFAIMNDIGTAKQPSPAALTGIGVLRKRVERVAHTGRLRIPVDRAVALIHAAGVGAVTTLLTTPDDERDQGLSAAVWEAVLAALIADPAVPPDGGAASLAVGLRAHLDGIDALTPGERLLLAELLDRLSRSPDVGRA